MTNHAVGKKDGRKKQSSSDSNSLVRIGSRSLGHLSDRRQLALTTASGKPQQSFGQRNASPLERAGPSMEEVKTRVAPGNVVEVSDLSVHFGATTVLKSLSFSLAKGSAVAIIGPNGAGKTVLLKTLIGALPFSGTVRWATGVHIGYVPQKLDLERDIPITGIDFLRARAAVAHKTMFDMSSVLTLVGIPMEIAQRPIGAMSGGQFQRLLIAFALVADPNVLLLDEPTAGIDEPGQEQLNELVRRLQKSQSLTVLFISHELSVVYQYANNVLCIGHEHSWVGPPSTILTPELLRQVYGGEVSFHLHEH